MKTLSSASLYKGFRFPPEIISYCVWLSFRFSLIFRDIEEIMAGRGIGLSYETVRQWCDLDPLPWNSQTWQNVYKGNEKSVGFHRICSVPRSHILWKRANVKRS